MINFHHHVSKGESRKKEMWTEEKFVDHQVNILKNEMKLTDNQFSERKKILNAQIIAAQKELAMIESREKMTTEEKDKDDQNLYKKAKEIFEEREAQRKPELNVSLVDRARILNEMQDFKSKIAVEILRPRRRRYDDDSKVVDYNPLFNHPDNIRCLFQDEGKPVPEWFAEKYSSAFEKAEPKLQKV
jgi:hypothetical protein